MKRYIRQLAPYALGFFVIGIAWGMWTQQKDRKQMASATPLRVLCDENWISDAVLQKFSRENKVPVQLYTYNRPSEFLRQVANSDGRIDVICTSSLLLKSLIQSHWVQKISLDDIDNIQLVSVDFLHLPYDPNGEYSVPLFWDLYGFFGKQQTASSPTWKQTWASKRVTLWGEELNLLAVMTRLGLKVEEKLQQEETKGIENEIRQFALKASEVLQPAFTLASAEAVMAKTDWIMLPLARVAQWLGDNSPYRFWLPEDGAAVEVGLLTIGSNAQQPALAKKLIGELLSTDHALEVHRRLGSGVVHSTLNNVSTVAPLQRAEAIRQFPLNRFEFPDLSVEALPRFQKIYDETFALNRGK